MMMKLSLIFFCSFVVQVFSAPLPRIEAKEVISGSTFKHSWGTPQKATVLVFLSATCPCSNAHVAHLIELAKTLPEIQFIGMHSNSDENEAESKNYFHSLRLTFPIIKDSSGEWADRLKAYRTPHAFLISQEGELLYAGGVTSSSDPKKALHFYLRDVLRDYLSGVKMKTSRTRVLGCEIARK